MQRAEGLGLRRCAKTPCQMFQRLLRLIGRRCLVFLLPIAPCRPFCLMSFRTPTPPSTRTLSPKVPTSPGPLAHGWLACAHAVCRTQAIGDVKMLLLPVDGRTPACAQDLASDREALMCRKLSCVAGSHVSQTSSRILHNMNHTDSLLMYRPIFAGIGRGITLPHRGRVLSRSSVS